MAGAASQISRKKHVQELSMEGVEVPDQYISKDPTALIRGPEDVKESLPFMDLPVIDFTRLITSHEEEVGKLREAFSSWGCFHIINHGIESIMDEIRKDAKEFFQLPMEEKLKYGKEPNDLEGYGNDNVALETQARDWIDRIFLTVTPQDQRRMHLWPKNPHSFRKTLQDYTEKATNVIEILIKFAAKSLDLPENIFLSKCGEKPLSHCRINFYPPCPKPELVFGLKPHTDGSVITLVLPDEEVEGFQFHKDGQWYRVRPLHGAFEVNLGDQFQVLSNGIFKSVFHRVVANKEKERMSIALFWNPEKGKGIGPLEELINENRPRLYNKVEDNSDITYGAYQKGTSALEVLKL